MDDTNPIDRETWWGCRRCPRWIRKDTWSTHGSCHAMVESALRLKLASDRATRDNDNLFLCGVCATGLGDATALMNHLETKHFTVFYRDKPGASTS